MLRATLVTDKGPIGVVGIVEENVRRMRAGMPLDIDLKEITPPGMQINRVVIHLAHDHEQVVRDMEAGGLPVSDELRHSAQALDVVLKRERRERERQQ